MQATTTGLSVLPAGEGQQTWFLGTLMTVKLAGEQTGDYTLIEFTAAPGFGPPPHIHHLDDEALYILEGELSGFCGDRTWRAGPGAFVYLPRGVPHGFRVEDDQPARGLQLGNASGFDRFVLEAGRPPAAPTLPPPPGPDDIARMLATAPRYGIEILPPPSQ